MKKYDLFYSIGTNCYTAKTLRSKGFRITSGPFDWIKNGSFDERINLIVNDFEDFLNKEDLKFNKDEANGQPYYANLKTDCHFIHDFSDKIPFDEDFISVKDKYDRRISRFYDYINKSQKTLLVWMSDKEIVAVDELIQAQKLLSEKFKKNIDLLVIENDDNLKLGECKKQEINSNIVLFKTKIKNLFEEDDEIRTEVEKVFDEIFSEYALNKISTLSFPKLLKKNIIRFVSNLILNKELRHKFRHKYLLEI